MKPLIKRGFNKDNIISFGNMFLLGNGRYGYRGTLEEFTKSEMVALNMLGVYDQYQDKWRESVNLPNPFFIQIFVNNELQSVLTKEVKEHEVELDIENAIFRRKTVFKDITIESERFVSSLDKNILATKYRVIPNNNLNVEVRFGLDLDIYDINGPHFKNKEVKRCDNSLIFEGITNEGRLIKTKTTYLFNGDITYLNGLFTLKSQKEVELIIISEINKESSQLSYEELKQRHIDTFKKKWEMARVLIDDDEAQFELDYSIYHLLILEDNESFASIPARGLSGQTYKGAIFWDTEVFMLPFYALTNPKFARNLIKYRINTLDGAKKKARSVGFIGAFYAWESQEDGVERCSKYNVTDPITNEPIRTYFDERQIHISADVAIAIKRYVEVTGDKDILKEGGYDVIYECAKFFYARASSIYGLYTYLNVIGPDEYHENVQDNAFTNYMAYETIRLAVEYYDDYQEYVTEKTISKKIFIEFLKNIYLPKPDKDGIIEQFKGYFTLEDVLPQEVLKRRKNEKEYLGFIASKTKTIKQADVIALLAILPNDELNKHLKENYDYYLKYTEHGSSLSSSMYSLSASKLKRSEDAYNLFRKSSSIDLGTDQKMYAGGIYIGGTHPASNAGAYISVVLGFAGFRYDGQRIWFEPSLPKSINRIEFKFYFQNKKYHVVINKDSTYTLKEEKQ